MSGTQASGGLGSHTGGNKDGPDLRINANSPASASCTTVTNQHLLSLPNSVHENLSAASRKALSIIEVEFALKVSQATTHAYTQVLEQLRHPAPATITSSQQG